MYYQASPPICVLRVLVVVVQACGTSASEENRRDEMGTGTAVVCEISGRRAYKFNEYYS